MKKVEIVWRDITSLQGWLSQNQIDNFITGENIVTQIGYLYEEDEEHFYLLDSYFLDRSMFGGIHKIPKGCIIKINYL